MKLEEGKKYQFRVVKTIEFEEKEFFLLEGKDSRRYLMPAERYRNYHIGPGKSIICRVDKINCKGEVFLEPDHPYYMEKRPYLFRVSGYDTRIDRSGKIHNVVLVNDVDENEISVPEEILSNSRPVKGESVELVIGRIAKGKIEFEGMPEIDHGEREEDELLVDFSITEEMKGMDGRNYFLVEQGGSVYTIPVDYYSHYGLKQGSAFKGRFIRYKAGAEVRIEPVNPFFIQGEVYKFTVREVVEVGDAKNLITVVTDNCGFSHNIDCDLGKEAGDSVMMRVERIRKGWPLLKLM